jgi:hypothetical protein
MASYDMKSRRISIHYILVLQSLTDDWVFQQILFFSTFFKLTEDDCFIGLAFFVLKFTMIDFWSNIDFDYALWPIV